MKKTDIRIMLDMALLHFFPFAGRRVYLPPATGGHGQETGTVPRITVPGMKLQINSLNSMIY